MREANGSLAFRLTFGMKSRFLGGFAASVGLYWIGWLCAIFVGLDPCGEAKIVSIGVKAWHRCLIGLIEVVRRVSIFPIWEQSLLGQNQISFFWSCPSEFFRNLMWE